MTNTSRHSGATCVSVGLQLDNGILALTITDNGTGISPEDLADTSSLGITGMRERARAVGGEFTISGAPGQGTSIMLVLTISNSEGQP